MSNRSPQGVVLRLLVGAAVLLASTPASASGATDFGFRDFSFGTASAPTAQKPQSKLWINDGAWWASMYNPATKRFSIHRLDRSTNKWTDTGTTIDSRRRSYADTLWDGNRLYVATAPPPGASGDLSARVLRYSYDASTKRYTLDAGFPVTVVQAGLEAIVLDKDSLGRLWVTYTNTNSSGGRSVYVAHSTTSDAQWGKPYVLPVAGASNATSDDISSIVAFGGKIGVLWGNQNDDAYYFAVHRDGDPDSAWSVETALKGPDLADDHMTVKAVEGGSGAQVFGAVKTSRNAASDPLVYVVARDADGTWRRAVYGTVADNHTRPAIALDALNRNAYVFTASPCCSGGVIYYKKTSMDSLSFPTGLGTPFIRRSTDPKINNPTTTKQTVDGATGLTVLAGDDSTDFYLHNDLALAGSAPAPAPDTTIDSGPSGTVTSSSASFEFSSQTTGATFECRLDGGSWVGCSSPVTYSGLADGAHTFEVRAVDGAGTVDPTPATRTWTIDSSAPLFADGFESGDFSRWTTTRTGADGTATVQTALVREGTRAARLTATAATGSYAYIRESFGAAQTRLTVSADLRVEAEGASGGNVPLFRLLDAGGTRLVSLYRQNLSSDRVYVGHSGTRYLTTARLPLRTWARFELRVITAGTGTSTVEVVLNGTSVYRTTSASLGTAGVATLQIGNDTARQAFDLVADGVTADVW